MLLLLTLAMQLDEGFKLFDQGRLEEARAMFEAAVKKQPANALAWKSLGVTYAATEDYIGAEEPFRKACSLNDKLEDACYYWGRALFALNRFEPSLPPLRKALIADKQKGRAHLALAQSLEAMGLATEAEKEFRESIRIAERSQRDARVRYARFLYRQGRLEEARKPLADALAADDTHAEAAAELGRIHYQAGELDAARSRLEAAGKNIDWAVLLLAKVYRRLGLEKDAAALETQGLRKVQ